MVHVPKEVREREATKDRSKQKKTGNDIQPTGTKLRPAAERLLFLGYTLTSYTFLNPVTKQIIESRDISFWFENLHITDVWPTIFDTPQPSPENFQQLLQKNKLLNVTIKTTPMRKQTWYRYVKQARSQRWGRQGTAPVSYTHLTLPTIYSV